MGVVGLIMYSPEMLHLVSFLAGSMLMTASIGVMAWTLHLLFLKKSIALIGGLIVVKYGILGAIIFWVTRQPVFVTVWFAAGLGLLLPSVLLLTIWEKRVPSKG